MLTRRTFDILLSAMGPAFIAKTALGDENETATVRLRGDETVRTHLQPMEESGLTIEEDDSEEAKTLAKHTPPGRAIPIFLIIAGAIALIKILELIQELYRKTYYGGVLIDVRERPPLITNDLKIPADMVFVINKDGTTTQYQGRDFNLSELTTLLKTK